MKITTFKRLEKLNRIYTRQIVERLMDNLDDDLTLEAKRHRVRNLLKPIWALAKIDSLGNMFLNFYN